MKAFIFDMDGTMVDNMKVHLLAWQQKLAELGMDLTFEEVREQIHGVNEEIVARLFGDRFTPEARRAVSDDKEARYREVFRDRLHLIAGLPELLKAAHAAGIPMGIGTAAPIENVDFVLDTLHIRHYFQTVLSAGDVQKGKPDPEVFLKAAHNLGVAPEDCLVFEDSPTGARAARNAGMKAVIINTTHQPPEFAAFENVLRCVPDFRGLDVAGLLALLV